MTDISTQQNSSKKRHQSTVVDHTNTMESGAPELVTGNGDVGGELQETERNGVDEEDTNGETLGQSPRYEAYLMTGDKMLRLNSKISPNYAKMKQAELPRHTEVLSSSPIVSRGPFSDLQRTDDAFGAYHQRRSKRRQQSMEQNGLPMPPSQSENGLADSSTTKAASVLATVSNEQQPENVRPELLDGDRREPSIVTVHGFNHNRGGYWKGSSADGPASSTDIDHGESRSTLQSGQAVSGADLPSPTSPSYYSEPVSPARFAFVGGSMPGSSSPASKRIQHEQAKIHRQNGDASPSSLIRIQQEHRVKEETTTKGATRQDTTGGTLIISVTEHASSGPVETIPSSFVVAGPSSDSDSPTGSVSSTPLKERMQRFEAASRSSSLSTTGRELDAEAAKRLAKRLFTLEGFRKSDVAKHLVKNNEFSNLVALEYLKQFNFAGLRLDAAIRKFLHHFVLTGETSERERIISYFSKRYYECNPGLFSFEDEVHTLTCALLLLNTDLHSQNVSKRMSCHDFIENISQAGYTFPRDLLRALYQSIKNQPIEWAKDQSESDATASSASALAVDKRFVEMPDPDAQVEYKKGWVMRKCVIDEDGKPMPFGRRSWRMFYATLKGMVLYLHKDEHGFKKSSYQTFRNAIRIHHALASRASDYIKKQHVFRLHTAGLAEFLFQTSDPKDMQFWISTINFVAASFSAPALPPAVSARQSFHRPLLPAAPTKLSMKDQCQVHEARIKDLERMLSQHRNAAPARTARPRQLQDYAEKEIFLLFDLQKYTTYSQVLQSRLEEQWERTGWTDLQESTTAASEMTVDELGNGNTQAGRVSAQSGQSDRLSYRAAISSAMGPSASTRTSYETNL